MKNKWYTFKNKASGDKKVVDLMVYGPIVSGSWKWDESDVVAQDFIKAFDGLKEGDEVNMYINSPGGSVFTTAGIIAIVSRAKEKGVYVRAHGDGLMASCASFLPMVADEIIVYDTSTAMVHRAMCGVYGNADDLTEMIELLEQLEDSIIIPMYMSKAKEGVTEEQLKNFMKVETWFDADAFAELFDVKRVENTKKVAACIDEETMKNYKNTPNHLKNKQVEPQKEEEQSPENTELERAKLKLAMAM